MSELPRVLRVSRAAVDAAQAEVAAFVLAGLTHEIDPMVALIATAQVIEEPTLPL